MSLPILNGNFLTRTIELIYMCDIPCCVLEDEIYDCLLWVAKMQFYLLWRGAKKMVDGIFFKSISENINISSFGWFAFVEIWGTTFRYRTNNKALNSFICNVWAAFVKWKVPKAKYISFTYPVVNSTINREEHCTIWSDLPKIL